jgi:hypothetical protein
MGMRSRPSPDRRVAGGGSERPQLTPTLGSNRPSIHIRGGRGADSESIGRAIPDARESWGRWERAWRGMDMDWENGHGEGTGT